jgi:pyruvate, water dikinase
LHVSRKDDIICPDFVPTAKLSVALVSNKGGITSHTAMINRALNIPTVVGTESGTKILEKGIIAMVDSWRGIISISI